MAQTLQQTSIKTQAQLRSATAKAKGRRRQFRSCDQCRKGKRACDIIVPQDDFTAVTGSCSNCTRTGKDCTVEWLKSKSEGIGSPQATGRRPSACQTNPTTSTTHEDIQGWDPCDWNENQEILSALGEVWDPPLSPSLYIYQQNSEPEQSKWSGSSTGTSAPSTEVPVSLLQNRDPNILQNNSNTSMGNTISFPNHGTNPLPSRQSHMHVREEDQEDETSQEGYRISEKHKRYSMPNSSSRTPRKPTSRITKHRPSFVSSLSPVTADPSSANLEYRLASSANKSFISGNLLKIYHDSMENALSCWLTEKTCPYDVEVRPFARKLPSKENPMTKEWGSLWSNRICERVCNLDKRCGSLRGRPLSQSENAAVDVALRKTIMSFATQWAYSSTRSAAEFHSSGPTSLQVGETGYDDPGAAFSAEFDRSMQEMLWHEARSSLQETSDITSFRLVFANMVFALTQRPRNIAKSLQELKLGEEDIVHEMVNDGFPNFSRRSGTASTNGTHYSNGAHPEKVNHTKPMLDRVLDLEGPPVYLERALRQMFTYRCKLEKLESQERINMKKSQTLPNNAPSITQCGPLDVADRQTFNLLFWLGIMFDTLSAAINKRPLVVSDEDSDILRDDDFTSQPNMELENFNLGLCAQGLLNNSNASQLRKKNESELWGEFFVPRGSFQQAEPIPRWPCSHEAASSTLCDAAPIKVVLFRRVTRLQTLLSRRTGPEKIEIAIGDALMVHDYWNTKYGPFFRDCISYHETLPPRIQSWYIVLAGHWHLAGLLLADLIEEIDDREAGMDNHRATRTSKRLVESLRLHNAFAISDLGRCSYPRPNSSFSQAKEFHAAVNNGALLTEPWTEVLIQSFSKACSVLLDMFPESEREGYFNAELFIDRCESCVKALWYLGKKSDIAMLASSVLNDALKESVELLRRGQEMDIPTNRDVRGDGGVEQEIGGWDNMGQHQYHPLGNFVGCL